MINQITIDENNNVTKYSIGGLIPLGITVDSIPEDVQVNWKAYKYIDGAFVFNADYVPPVEPEPPQTADSRINNIEDMLVDFMMSTLS